MADKKKDQKKVFHGLTKGNVKYHLKVDASDTEIKDAAQKLSDFSFAEVIVRSLPLNVVHKLYKQVNNEKNKDVDPGLYDANIVDRALFKRMLDGGVGEREALTFSKTCEYGLIINGTFVSRSDVKGIRREFKKLPDDLENLEVVFAKKQPGSADAERITDISGEIVNLLGDDDTVSSSQKTSSAAPASRSRRNGKTQMPTTMEELLRVYAPEGSFVHDDDEKIDLYCFYRGNPMSFVDAEAKMNSGTIDVKDLSVKKGIFDVNRRKPIIIPDPTDADDRDFNDWA